MALVSFTPNTVIKSADVNANNTGLSNWSLLSGSSSVVHDYIVPGTGILAISSGLIGTFSNIQYFISGQYYTATSIANKTYTASKDTYVDINTSGTVTYTEVANNAASAALSANNIRVGIAVSGVSLSSFNQGQASATAPTVSSNILTICDSLGNMIYNTNPDPSIIGYRVITASVNTTSGTPAAITGLSCPVIVPAGRKVDVLFGGRTQTNSSGFAGASIWDGTVGVGTQLARTYSGSSAAFNTPAYCEAPPQQPSLTTNTSKTYNAGFEALSSGTTTFAAAATEPYFIKVRLV